MKLKDKMRIVELAEAECLADGFAGAPAAVATELGMSVHRIGGGVATIMRDDFICDRLLDAETDNARPEAPRRIVAHYRRDASTDAMH
jgi:hypothetical protein